MQVFPNTAPKYSSLFNYKRVEYTLLIICKYLELLVPLHIQNLSAATLKLIFRDTEKLQSQKHKDLISSTVFFLCVQLDSNFSLSTSLSFGDGDSSRVCLSHKRSSAHGYFPNQTSTNSVEKKNILFFMCSFS